MTTKITEANIEQTTLDNLGSGPLIANVQIANSSYTVLDDTAVSLDGGYIILNGSKFEQNVNVLINNIPATSVVYVSETQVRAQIPAATAGSKHVYVVNTDTGATAIRVNGLTYSGVPSWNTDSSLGEGILDEPIIISLSATADSNVSYQLQTGSSLPTGLSLAANGLLSGTVTGLEEETLYNFTIEAIDEENQESPRAFSVTIVLGDEYFNQTVLLLKGDGTNGAQNNTFLDSSTNNFTITRNGNTTQGTFSPFSAPDGRWSNYFDGNRAYFTLASNSDFAFGTGAYTVEAWVYQTAYDSASSIIFSSASASGGFNLGIGTNGSLGISKYGFGGVVDGNAGDIPLNTWCHIAAVRTSTASNDTRLYVNGTLIKTGTDSNNWTVSSSPSIGAFTNLLTYDYFGYISNLSVVKGTAITPSAGGPTSPLSTSTTNQVLLICQSNRFVDANTATTAKAITVNGTIKVTPFSPFAPTAAYSASVNGGSGYFDGSGDNLTVSTNSALSLGSGDFTVEAWVYPTTSAVQGIVSFGAGSTVQPFIYLDGLTPRFLYNNVNVALGPSLIQNSWNHVAITRSGTTIRVYTNGTSGTAASPYNDTFTNAGLFIGSNNGSSQYLIGYVSSLRVIPGTAIYTGSTLTVPTSPVTAISGTAFLANFTNAGIFDNTGKNVLETVDNAQVATSVVKFGTGSMKFDGTGDYLLIPTSTNNEFGTGDFTIEFWIYPNTTVGSGGDVIFDRRSSATTRGRIISLENDGKIYFYGGDTNTGAFEINISTSVLTASQWYHYALTKSGSTYTCYLNGVLQNSAISSATLADDTSPTRIGAGVNNANYLDGYIDDLRITKGVARTITVPTKSFSVR